MWAGKLVIVRDVAGVSVEGVWGHTEAGMIPKCLVTGCRQIGFQDAEHGTPLPCEWWEVGDVLMAEHHIVAVHATNLQPR